MVRVRVVPVMAVLMLLLLLLLAQMLVTGAHCRVIVLRRLGQGRCMVMMPVLVRRLVRVRLVGETVVHWVLLARRLVVMVLQRRRRRGHGGSGRVTGTSSARHRVVLVRLLVAAAGQLVLGAKVLRSIIESVLHLVRAAAAACTGLHHGRPSAPMRRGRRGRQRGVHVLVERAMLVLVRSKVLRSHAHAGRLLLMMVKLLLVLAPILAAALLVRMMTGRYHGHTCRDWSGRRGAGDNRWCAGWVRWRNAADKVGRS